MDDVLHVGERDDAGAAALVQEEFGGPFLDSFHDFLAPFLRQVVLLKGGDILLKCGRSVFFQREGVAAHTELFGLFHRLLL